MSIQLRPEHADEIRAHGKEGYPHETCGFLLGHEIEGVKVVREVRRASNAREDSPENRFLIDPQEFMRAQRDAIRENLDIVGIYHSHPDVAARPSQFDRDHAWPWYSYVIVSVREGEPAELLSWIVPDETQPFAPEPLRVGA